MVQHGRKGQGSQWWTTASAPGKGTDRHRRWAVKRQEAQWIEGPSGWWIIKTGRLEEVVAEEWEALHCLSSAQRIQSLSSSENPDRGWLSLRSVRLSLVFFLEIKSQCLAKWMKPKKELQSHTCRAVTGPQHRICSMLFLNFKNS